MNPPKLAQTWQYSVAVWLLLGAAACAGSRKSATADSSAGQRAAAAAPAEPFVAPPVETPPSVTGVVDTGLALQFPAMDEQQVQQGLPSVRRQIRSAYPNLSDAQQQKMLERAQEAMRHGGSVLLMPE